MKLFASIGRTDETPAEVDERAERARERRIEQARERTSWREVPGLARRGPGGRWFVDEDGAMYQRYSGAIFDGMGIVRFCEQRADLVFVVRDSDVEVFEPLKGKNWFAIVERQAARR